MTASPIGSTTSTGPDGFWGIVEQPQLTMSVHRAADRAVITLVGEMDLAVEMDIQDLVTSAIADPGLRALHVDVAGVTFFGSAGLSSVLSARAAALGRGLAFTLDVGEAAAVARVLALFGLDTMLGLLPTTTSV